MSQDGKFMSLEAARAWLGEWKDLIQNLRPGAEAVPQNIPHALREKHALDSKEVLYFVRHKHCCIIGTIAPADTNAYSSEAEHLWKPEAMVTLNSLGENQLRLPNGWAPFYGYTLTKGKPDMKKVVDRLVGYDAAGEAQPDVVAAEEETAAPEISPNAPSAPTPEPPPTVPPATSLPLADHRLDVAEDKADPRFCFISMPLIRMPLPLARVMMSVIQQVDPVAAALSGRG